MRIVLIIGALSALLQADSFFYTKGGVKISLTKLPHTRTVKGDSIQYYVDPQGRKLGVSDRILIQCSASDSCDKVLQKYPLSKKKRITPNIYLLTVKKGEDIFLLSQRLFKEKTIAFAHPDFIYRKRLR